MDGEPVPARPGSRIGAVVLAAGRSGRMGGLNKLLAPIEGRAMLLHVLDAVQASRAGPAVVVLGHERERLARLLRRRNLVLVDNPDHARGLSSSLACGLAALPAACDGVLVCLGDMPWIKAAHLDRLIDAFEGGCTICVPTYNGRRGNPVLWARRFFAEMGALQGDRGAKTLMREYAACVCEIAMPDAGVVTDVDSPEALTAATSPRRR